MISHHPVSPQFTSMRRPMGNLSVGGEAQDPGFQFELNRGTRHDTHAKTRRNYLFYRLRGRTEVVAYCRARYYLLAPQAIERVTAKGYKARRLEGGMPEWRLAGLPVARDSE